MPTLELAIERGYINSEEARVLSVGIKKQHFKAGELKEELGALSARQRTHLVSKMKESGWKGAGPSPSNPNLSSFTCLNLLLVGGQGPSALLSTHQLQV